MEKSRHSGSDERRRYVRIKTDIMASVFYHGDFFSNTVIEISEGGVLLAATNSYPVTAGIELCFTLPSTPSIVVQAELVYKLGPIDGIHYMGVRFTSISEAGQEMIAKYVSLKRAKKN